MVDLLGRFSRSGFSLVQIDPTVYISSDDGRKSARSRPVRVSAETSEEIVTRYREGEKIVELAQRFSVDRSTVIRQLRKAGVPKYAGWTDQVTADARELYEAGYSLADISQLIGWPPTTIGRHLKAEGVEFRPRGWA